MVPALNINLQNEHIPSLIAASGGWAELIEVTICNLQSKNPWPSTTSPRWPKTGSKWVNSWKSVDCGFRIDPILPMWSDLNHSSPKTSTFQVDSPNYPRFVAWSHGFRVDLIDGGLDKQKLNTESISRKFVTTWPRANGLSSCGNLGCDWGIIGIVLRYKSLWVDSIWSLFNVPLSWFDLKVVQYCPFELIWWISWSWFEIAIRQSMNLNMAHQHLIFSHSNKSTYILSASLPAENTAKHAPHLSLSHTAKPPECGISLFEESLAPQTQQLFSKEEGLSRVGKESHFLKSGMSSLWLTSLNPSIMSSAMHRALQYEMQLQSPRSSSSSEYLSHSQPRLNLMLPCSSHNSSWHLEKHSLLLSFVPTSPLQSSIWADPRLIWSPTENLTREARHSLLHSHRLG